MRKDSPLKYILPILFILIALSYFLFFMPSNIDCGILIEKKELKNSYKLKILCGKNTKWVTVKKEDFIESEAYKIKLKGLRTVYIKPLKSIKGKVFAKDINTINIDDKIYNLNNTFYYLTQGKTYKLVTPNYVIVGLNYKFILDDNNIKAILITYPKIEKIRVGLSNQDFSSYDHNIITITSKKGFNIFSKDFQIQTKGKDVVTFSLLNDKIKVELNKNIFITDKRIFIYPKESPILITSLRRNNGYIPEYFGSIEIFLNNKKLRIINEIDIEDYLKYVVPSEMPGYGGVEGYKVQSVAARTYAISEILNGRFSKYGFNIDDTTKSQVYNERPTNDLCKKAIEETKGEVLTYEGKIIDAKYYSTSCGLGAAYDEFYKEPLKQNPKPYLDFKNYTNENIARIDSKEKASKFFKDWTLSAVDSNSPYFRWKFTLPFSEMNKTINENIYKRYLKNPNDFKEKWFLNFYKKANIPKEGIGDIKDIYISKISRSGIPQEMIIITNVKKIKILGPSNIKYILTPKEINIETISGLKFKTENIPSPFFIIDKIYNKNKIKEITIFGGGYGHGVGMSQYGAMNLAIKGKNYREILSFFYKDIKIQNYNEILY
ncbi:Stage II sporulation protein [Caloramator fervidus]|uniref:Stage II sporulation protein n=1 Tax=Caloramator fervidus TaxID=29344 RepID=A0A1H5UX47_9CLOT|nr:SpoIID/LytB domain-containing protein [Caloramator fervidus]SEF78787.1 Stage II sporulation protein [Caloramator fervidus]